MEAPSVSPNGAFELRLQHRSGRMSHDIFTPCIVAAGTGESLLEFPDSNWSLDGHQWQGDSVVRLVLRKYPGNHLPAEPMCTVDLTVRSATLDDGAVIARRIVPFVQQGENVAKGDRICLIQFGSRADVYLPLTAKIRVQLGDRVVGGETIVATLG